MLLYFLRIIEYFLMIFCTVVLGITLMVIKLKQCTRPSAGDHFGVFWALFWHMYIFFLISVQYFVIKLCTGVLSITLIVTNTKIFLTSCPALQRVHFGTYFGILRLLFENCSICSHEILYRCSWCSFEGHCTIFFPYHDPAGDS